jgi:hypothetical protein
MADLGEDYKNWRENGYTLTQIPPGETLEPEVK